MICRMEVGLIATPTAPLSITLWRMGAGAKSVIQNADTAQQIVGRLIAICVMAMKTGLKKNLKRLLM